MKLNIQTTLDDVLELFDELDGDTKKAVLDRFTATQIIESLEKHLKGKGDYSAWDTSGWRFGSTIREAIAKMTGIEEEMRRDHESKVRSLEFNVKHYKQYYDWYFRLYHLDVTYAGERLIDFIQRTIGKPDSPTPKE